MNDATAPPAAKLGWAFPRTFWIANVVELFERAAYYGMAIALAVYLTDRIGFSDVAAGYVGAAFASALYLLPTFLGAFADRIGFRRSLCVAFALLTVGYALLGAFQIKATALLALAIIMLGGGFVKPVISGTVAKCSDEAHRARAFSIFYAMVNIGAFTGKSVARPLRIELGLEYINFYAAAMAFTALVWVALFYRDVGVKSAAKTADEAWQGLLRILRNGRFICLILIIAGFWAIQGQLYASMPKYILRLQGEGAAPEWLANINPLVVVLLVMPITHLVRRFRPANSIAVGLFIMPLSALTAASSPFIESLAGGDVRLFGRVTIDPITFSFVIGIALQGLAECFLSPKFLEYASKQAPPGEEGLYMGYQHLTTFFAWAFGFAISGHLLERFCPDPNTLSAELQQARLAAIESGGPMPEVYAHAHYIWYVFSVIGLAAFAALLIFKLVTEAIDRRRAAPRTEPRP